MQKIERSDAKAVGLSAGLAALVASLCCFAPIVLVLTGIATFSFAASIEGVLYGQYDWIFQAIGGISLATALFLYFYKYQGICTLDKAKRNRNRIINITIIAVILAVVLYYVWFYIAIPYIGTSIGYYKK